MEQYVLLAEVENTLFFYHANQPHSKKENSYNLYQALNHIKLLKNNDTIVVIFSILTDDTMDVFIIQHKNSASLKQMDKDNLEQIFDYLKKMDTPRNIFMMYYYTDKETYETTVINGILPYIKHKQIEAIEYVEFQDNCNTETVEEPIVEDGNLDQPMKLSKSLVETVVEPVVEPLVETVVETVAVAEPVVEPLVETVVETVAETVVETVVETVAVAEPVVETVAETVVEPETVAETVVEPVTETVAEPVVETVVETVTETVTPI
jgi:hypothetical protein